MKKIIAMLLALVMILGCLAACNQTPPEQTKDTTPPKETTEYVAPTQNTEKIEELGKLPLTEEDVTLTIGIMQSANTEDYETNDYTLWLEEQTGIDLQFKYFSNDKAEAVTQLNLMIAGNEKLPDILWGFTGVDSAMMYELGEDEYFVDVKDYFSEYGYWLWEEYEYVPEGDRTAIFQYGTDPSNGALYAFPRYAQGGVDIIDSMAVINTKWLEAIGEAAPTTVDELYNVLKKFATEDPNGNGKADEIPVVGYEGGYRTDIIQWIINAFVYCLDTDFFNVTDGQVWVPYTTEEYRQAMIYLNKLYGEGLITPMFYTITDKAELTALMTPADGVAISGIGAAHASLHYEKDNAVIFEYAALAPLKAATELGGYAAVRGSTYEYNTFITTDCENPELAFKLLDFMCGQESFLRQRNGVYGVHWEWADEGTYSSVGAPATIKAIDASVYSSQNNTCWHDVRATITTQERNATAANVDTATWAGYKSKLAADIRAAQLAVEAPAEVVHKFVYNASEQETVSSLKTPLSDYVAEARAMFISGVMDPNDDAQWNTYLANLEAQGLQEYIEAAQSAYSRMTSN